MAKQPELTPEQEMQEQLARVRLPRPPETLGIVEQRVGGSRMKTNCRIPGRLKRKLWVREGDIVLVEPWELCGDEKGDVIFKYKPIQVQFLKKKGYLRQFEDMDEF